MGQDKIYNIPSNTPINVRIVSEDRNMAARKEPDNATNRRAGMGGSNINNRRLCDDEDQKGQANIR